MNDNDALLTSPWGACGELLNQLIEFAPKPGTHRAPRDRACRQHGSRLGARAAQTHSLRAIVG